MKPKPRVVRNASSVGAALPRSLDELARIPGGPFALIEQAERQAGDAEARFWLDVLEHHVAQALAKGVTGDDLMLSAIVHGWLKSLRQRLGVGRRLRRSGLRPVSGCGDCGRAGLGGEPYGRSARRSGRLLRVPTINLDDDELAAVIATVRRVIEDDRFPRAPRLDPLRALAKLEPATKAAASQNREAGGAITGGAFDDGAVEGGLAGGLLRTCFSDGKAGRAEWKDSGTWSTSMAQRPRIDLPDSRQQGSRFAPCERTQPQP